MYSLKNKLFLSQY